jgi:hypothetical protein
MEQVLFMLRGGKISQWNLLRGKLVAVTVRGQHKVPYSAETANAYWGEWKEDNMVASGDVYDAIFLSESPDDFGELPKWICANSKDKSVWTIEQLSLLASEAEYKRTGLCLVQGNVKRLIGTEKADGAIRLCVKSSLVFTLPKETVKPKASKTKNPKKSDMVGEGSDVKARIEPSSNVFIGDSYNDSKASLLKIGDKINCTVVSIRSARGFCYLKSDKTSELIRVKLDTINKTLSIKSSVFSCGMKLLAEVVSVKGQVVEYKIEN